LLRGTEYTTGFGIHPYSTLLIVLLVKSYKVYIFKKLKDIFN